MFKTFSQSLKPNTTLQNQIKLFTDVFSPDFLQRSLKLTINTELERATVGGRANGESVANPFVRDAFFVHSESEEYEQLKLLLKQKLTECLYQYLSSLNLLNTIDFNSLTPDTDFSFVVYEPSSRGYTQHVDAFTKDSSLAERLFSCVYYLNNDFIGGELYFPNLNHKIKIKENMCVIFPSTYFYSHVALPLIEGRKVICPAWFGYKPPKEINYGYIL